MAVLAILSLIVSILTLSVSGYYSYKWFDINGTPHLLSMVIAFTYVIFANIVFEIGADKIAKAKSYRIKILGVSKQGTSYRQINAYVKRYRKEGILILIGWSFLALFSMYCSVGGQYDQLMNVDKNKTQEVVSIIVDNSELIFLKEKRLSALQNEEATYISRGASITSMEDRHKYKNNSGSTEASLAQIQDKIEKITTELEPLYAQRSLSNAIKESDKELGINKRSFFNYVSDIIKNRVEPKLIQFWSTVFPSIVFDIISPIGLTIFMFWYKGRKKG